MNASDLNPRKLPPSKIHPNLSKITTIGCAVCGRPVYCSSHRNNHTPFVGWAFVRQSELQLINILRENQWEDAALHEVIEVYNRARMDALIDGASNLRIGPSTPPQHPAIEAVESSDDNDD